MTVVNFSTPQFIKGQQRLMTSIQNIADISFIGFTDVQEINSPTHSESPYQFKIHAIEKVFERGAKIVLWADSSLYHVGRILKIKQIIEQDGYFMEEAGHYVSRWCNQHALNYFKLTSEEARTFTMFSAGLLGLNVESPIAMEFFRQWKAAALAGCFRGDWLDHRHDMTCGSIIAQRLGMKYQHGGTHLAYIGKGYAPPNPEAVFYCQGM